MSTDIAQYESLVSAHHAKLEEQPALLANTTFLKEKITLMCLTETLFQRIGPSGDRTVPFKVIATAASLPVEQVELLIMRALSLKLIVSGTRCAAVGPPRLADCHFGVFPPPHGRARAHKSLANLLHACTLCYVCRPGTSRAGTCQLPACVDLYLCLCHSAASSTKSTTPCASRGCSPACFRPPRSS